MFTSFSLFNLFSLFSSGIEFGFKGCSLSLSGHTFAKGTTCNNYRKPNLMLNINKYALLSGLIWIFSTHYFTNYFTLRIRCHISERLSVATFLTVWRHVMSQSEALAQSRVHFTALSLADLRLIKTNIHTLNAHTHAVENGEISCSFMAFQSSSTFSEFFETEKSQRSEISKSEGVFRLNSKSNKFPQEKVKPE